RLRGAAEHVADELAMAGRVDDGVAPVLPGEPHAGGVDGDGLIALGLQGVEHERPFQRHAAALADGLEFFELADGQAVGVVEQAADGGRLAVVDVAEDRDAQGTIHYMYPAVRRRSNESSES